MKEDSDVCSKCGEHCCEILECEKEPMKEFKVKFTGEQTVRIKARNKEEAREKAEENFDGYVDWDIEAVEIEE